MREFLEYSVKLLAQAPDQVEVTETIDGTNVTYQLGLAPEDVGRIIGREGAHRFIVGKLHDSDAVRTGRIPDWTKCNDVPLGHPVSPVRRMILHDLPLGRRHILGEGWTRRNELAEECFHGGFVVY